MLDEAGIAEIDDRRARSDGRAVACFEQIRQGPASARLNFARLPFLRLRQSRTARRSFSRATISRRPMSMRIDGKICAFGERRMMTPSPNPRPRGRRPSRQPPGAGDTQGALVTLAPLDAHKHAVSLYDGSNGEPERERVWTYLGDGPLRQPAGFPREPRDEGALGGSAVLRGDRQRRRAARSATRR